MAQKTPNKPPTFQGSKNPINKQSFENLPNTQNITIGCWDILTYKVTEYEPNLTS